MNKKLALALLTGAAVITICLIRRANALNKKLNPGYNPGLRSTPGPYEYTL